MLKPLSLLSLAVLGVLHCNSGAAQEDTYTLTKRGVVKRLSSERDPIFPDQFQTLLRLSGTGERALCQQIKIHTKDTGSMEIIKLAMRLNKPLEASYTVARGNQDARDKNPEHCELTALELRN